MRVASLFLLHQCTCEGALTYQVVNENDNCYRRKLNEAGEAEGEEVAPLSEMDKRRELICGRRNLKEGAEQRELNAATGLTFSEWLDEISLFYPGCALAPIRSQEQLDYYTTIQPSGAVTETLIGIVQSDPIQAAACKKAWEKNPKETPKECLEGWINIIDGSKVDVDPKWFQGQRPKGLDGNGVFMYVNLSTQKNGQMWDQCDYELDSDCARFPNALIECCIQPTCYSEPLECDPRFGKCLINM